MQLQRRAGLAWETARQGSYSLAAPDGVLRRFGKMLSGMSLRLLLQSGYFVLLARFLGPAQYGMFVAAASTSLILSTLGALGAEVMLPKSVSRGDVDLRTGIRCALGNLLVGAPALMIVSLVLTMTLASPGLPVLATLAICLSDAILFRINGVMAVAHLSVDRLWRHVTSQMTVNIARLVAVIAATALLPAGSVLAWSLAYLAATGLGALASIVPLWRELGSLPPIIRGQWLREGVFFALSTSAQIAYYEMDKPLINRLISAEASGLYAAATRITDAASTPIWSIVGIMITRFFKRGAHGVRSSLALAKRVLLPVIAIGLLIPLALWIATPYVPLVLGQRYAAVQGILPLLSIMPLLTGCFFITADVLTSTGRQALRSVVQFAGVLLKLPISFVLARQYGLIGCVWAVIASSLLLLGVTIAMVLYEAARDTDGRPAPASVPVR